MNAIKKETTPAEFAEQLQQAATGEHDQLCRDGIPNETLATEAIEYIIDGMPVQEKAEWLQAFTEAIPGRSPAGLTFGSVIADFRGTLKELRKALRTKGITDSERPHGTYGLHQENEAWIIKTFERVENQQPSQNKTVERVQELYRQQFDRIIGKSTILRAVGRID